MTQDVQQWLTEIQSLQQRLAHVSQERATAYEQLTRWQRSYQTEAQQRRKDIRRLQTVIYRLDQENKRLKQQLELPLDGRSLSSKAQEPGADVEAASPVAGSSQPLPPSEPAMPGVQDDDPQHPQPLELLQKKLQDAIAECDRLSKALSQEQAEHEQTRQTLMNALGDTVEQLERERKRYTSSLNSESQAQSPAIAPQKQDSQSQLTGHQPKQLPPSSS
ncbi:MAG: hypothetical protein F6K65_41965 [Moorea sp. SIO3C2]|nr:hypothetical protein [Moorena sp. SIO3C2]